MPARRRTLLSIGLVLVGAGRGSRTAAVGPCPPFEAPCHDRAQLWRGRAGRQGRAFGPRFGAPDGAPLTAHSPARRSAQVLVGEGLAKDESGQKRTLRPVLPAVDPRGAFDEGLDQARLQTGASAAFAVIGRFTRQHRFGWAARSGERARPSVPECWRPIRTAWHRRRRMSPTVFRDGRSDSSSFRARKSGSISTSSRLMARPSSGLSRRSSSRGTMS